VWRAFRRVSSTRRTRVLELTAGLTEKDRMGSGWDLDGVEAFVNSG
jgi:hypothetical protein